MSEDNNLKNNSQKSESKSKDSGKEVKNYLTSRLIFIVCYSLITFVGINFISCTFMIPGTIERANALGGLKNPPPLNCKESQKRGYEVLLAVLSTVIALRAKVD
jgi:quinol-cytochrome oxidoreductase complex cytochrome b subunit